MMLIYTTAVVSVPCASTCALLHETALMPAGNICKTILKKTHFVTLSVKTTGKSVGVVYRLQMGLQTKSKVQYL